MNHNKNKKMNKFNNIHENQISPVRQEWNDIVVIGGKFSKEDYKGIYELSKDYHGL